MKIIWFSRHPALPSQRAELRRLYGDDVGIIPDPHPFDSAKDILERFHYVGGDEMVVVAPLSVLGRLCDLGVKPLWADMELVSIEEAEVVAAGRGYRFIRFRRVKRLVLEFEEE